MAESPNNLPNEFAQDRLVRSIQQTCAPRQRALLSLLAICEKHQLDPRMVIGSLAQDLPRTPLESRRKTGKFYWSRVQDFSNELTDVQAIPDGLAEHPDLLPDNVELALRISSDEGTLDEFNTTWLNRPPHLGSSRPRNQPAVANIFSTYIKGVTVLSVATFIMIYIVPEFKAMLEEFDMDIPAVFQLTLDIAIVGVRYSIIPFFLILLSFLFFTPSLRQYFRRWNPFTWQQPIIPAAVSTRQALALTTANPESVSAEALTDFPELKQSLEDTQNESGPDWHDLAEKGVITAKEKEALELASSGEVQAWLLQASAVKKHHRLEGRRVLIARTIVTIVNIILGGLVLLLALSVFATLITLMSNLA